jgi:hypothetical protein
MADLILLSITIASGVASGSGINRTKAYSPRLGNSAAGSYVVLISTLEIVLGTLWFVDEHPTATRTIINSKTL